MAYTLLAADDDAHVLKLLKEELDLRGYVVLTASNGPQAIRLAQAHRPDLIILDVAMPMGSGLKAFEVLRKHPETLSIPVIFLTGVPSADVYPAVEQGTRVAHVKKPVDVVELDSLIKHLLEKYPKRS